MSNVKCQMVKLLSECTSRVPLVIFIVIDIINLIFLLISSSLDLIRLWPQLVRNSDSEFPLAEIFQKCAQTAKCNIWDDDNNEDDNDHDDNYDYDKKE